MAMTSLKDKFILLIESFNLLISFLMLSLIKLSSKDGSVLCFIRMRACLIPHKLSYHNQQNHFDPLTWTVLIAFLTIGLNYFDYICYTTYLAFSLIWICQNPDFISNLENTTASLSLWTRSFLLGIGYLIHSKTLFKGLQLITNQGVPLSISAFFCT